MEFVPVSEIKGFEYPAHLQMFQASQCRRSVVSVLVEAHRGQTVAVSDRIVVELSLLEARTRGAQPARRPSTGTAAALDDLRTDLNDGLDNLAATLDQGFAQVTAQLERGFDRVARGIEELKSVPDWYRSFARSKNRVWQLAAQGHFERAVDEALAALSTSDRSRSETHIAPDEVWHDPELNLFVAQAAVLALAPEDKDLGENPFAFAARAYEGGYRSDDPSEAQAASDAAHLLAIYARAVGDLDWAARLDLESYRLEQRDKVAALARAYAALVLVDDAEAVGQAVALATLVIPRFGGLWLTQPALLVDRARANAVLDCAERCLADGLAEANRLLVESIQAWTAVLLLLPAGDGSPAKLAAAVPVDASATLLELAAACRRAIASALSNVELFRDRASRGVESANRPAFAEASRLQERVKSIETDRANARERYNHYGYRMEKSGFIRNVGWLGSPAFGLYMLVTSLAAHHSCSDGAKTGGLAILAAGTCYVLLYYAIKVALSSAANNQPGLAQAESAPYDAKNNAVRAAVRELGDAVSALGLVERVQAARAGVGAPEFWTLDRWREWLDPSHLSNSRGAVGRLVGEQLAPVVTAPEPPAVGPLDTAVSRLHRLL